MADIPAANLVKTWNTAGKFKQLICKVKGDGTGVTIPTGLKNIVGHAVGNIDESDGYNPAISFASGIITYATAPTSTKYHYLFVWGY
jgi:hypothetical protein